MSILRTTESEEEFKAKMFTDIESKYLKAIRNLTPDDVQSIEKTPEPKPDDSAHTAYCKRLFQQLAELEGE